MNRASLVGAPCESARYEGRGRFGHRDPVYGPLCGRPSRFIWLGIDPSALNLTVAQRKKYIRAHVLMCWDCARRMYEMFCWQLKDGKAKLERLDVVKHRLHCKDCGTTAWVSWDTDPGVLITHPGELKWCVRCGKRAAVILDHERDFLEVMAQDLAENDATPPIQLIQMLYEDWPRTDRRFDGFYDYFKYVMAHPEEIGAQ